MAVSSKKKPSYRKSFNMMDHILMEGQKLRENKGIYKLNQTLQNEYETQDKTFKK